MKINSINSFKPAFGHISKRAIDAVRAHAEGYRAGNESGESWYSTNPKYGLMTSDDLTQIDNLVLRASMLDYSWIDYDSQEDSLVVDFYKDCNPWQACRFDSQNEGDEKSALGVLENAVNVAEAGEYAKIDENKSSGWIWRAETKNANYTPERFRSVDDNKILRKIYNKTLDINV